MAPTSKPVLSLIADTGAVGTDRLTNQGTIDVSGLALGNAAVDVTKLSTANTTIDLSNELAQENETLTAAPGTLIAYGKQGFSGWAFRVVPASGKLDINSSTFGDPLGGIRKAAYLASSSLAPAGNGANSWQYSLDFGKTWSAPIAVGSTNRFQVPDGTYAEGQVRVRQTVITPPAANVNLLQNGSFEKGWTGTGWTPIRSMPGWTVGDQFEVWGTGMTNPSDGKYLLELDYAGAQDTISQAVSTTNGATYLLQFDLKSRGGGNETVEVYWRGTLLGTASASSTSSWKTVSFTVTGSGGSDVLTLREPANENNGLGALLDNFRLTSSTPPQAVTTQSESDTLFAAFSVDTSGPAVSLQAPGGSDRIVSRNVDDRLLTGKAEFGQTVSLLTKSTQSENFDSGILPSWVKFDIPNSSIATIKLDRTTGELDFSAQGGRTNLWDSRDNAPFAWVARPTVSQNETWFIEAKVRVDSRSQGETIAGITFSNGKDGDFQYGAPSFYVDSWHKSGTNVTLQGLGNNNPFTTADNATLVAGETASAYLRVEITEKGTSDDYQFYYRKSPTDAWSKLGSTLSYNIDNSRAALFYKTGGAKAGLAAFDDLKVGKLADVVLASDIAVASDGTFSYQLTDAQLKSLGEGSDKTLVAIQTDAAGNIGRSTTSTFTVDTEQTPVRIISIGGGDGKVSSQQVETGQGPLLLQVDQYTGYWSNEVSKLRSYVANFSPTSSNKKYSVQTDAIDFTDDQGGFAGELPYDKRWPAAEAMNVWGTGGINNQFFVKISGDFFVGEAGKYRFRTYNDDGVFLTIDNSLIISDPTLHPERVFTGDIDLAVGNHQLELFFFENGGEASLEFSVSRFDTKTNKWGAYQLVGKDPGLKARSVVEVDNKIVGTGEANRPVSLWLGDTLLGTTTVDSSGNFTYAMSPDNLALLAAASADVQIRATQTDSAGNISQTEPIAIALSEKTPVVNILNIGGADKLISTAEADALVEGKGEAGLTTSLLLGSETLKEIVSDSDGKFKFSLGQKEFEALGQGTGKALIAQQKQPSGTKGSSTPFTFSVDTLAPSVSITSVGSGNGRVSRIRPQITGTGEINSSVALKLNGQELGRANVASNGQFSYTLTDNNLTLIAEKTAVNAARTLTAVQVDAAGNTGVSTETDITAKLTPPALTITEVGGPDRIISTQAGDRTISGTCEPGLSVSVLFNGQLLGESSPAENDGKFSYTLSDSDLSTIGQGGPFQLSIRQVDEYGNTAILSSPPFSIDTVAPVLAVPQRGDAQSLGSLDGVVSTQLGDATINGNAEANRSVLISYNSNTLAQVQTTSDGKFSYTLTASDIVLIGQGTAKQLQLKQSDAAGNTASALIGFDVDTVPPEKPQIVDVATDAIVSGRSSDNIISGKTEAGARVTLIVSGRQLATVTANSKGAFAYQLTSADIATLGQRSLQIEAQIEDKAGNIARSEPFTFRIDTLAPEAPKVLSVGGDDSIVSTKGSGKVTSTVDNKVEGTAEAGSRVSVLSGTKLLGVVSADVNGQFTYSLTASNLASLGQGERKALSTIATDVAGNASQPSSTVNFSIDTLPPESPSIRSFGGDDGVMSLLPGDNQIIGLSEANTVIELRVLNGTNPVFVIPPISADSKGTWSYTFTVQQLEILEGLLLQGGSPQVQAIVTDKAGNEGASVSRAAQIDIKAPIVTLSKVGGSDGIVSSISGDNMIMGLAEANSTISLSSNGKVLGQVKTDTTGRFIYNLTSSNITTLGQGSSRQLVVSQTDTAGNVGTAATSFAIDTVAPGKVTISNLGGADKVVTARSGDHVVTGTAEAGTRLAIIAVTGATRTTLGFTDANTNGSFSYTMTAENLQLVQRGVGKNLMVSSYDQAGNRTDSSSYNYTVEAGWKAGTSANNVLSFASGVDVLTGRAGSDRFLLPSLGTALVGAAQTPAIDRITDFQIGMDQIDAPNAVAASQVRDLGQIQALTTTHLTQLLSSTALPTLGAAVFRQLDSQIGERTFLALNDSTAGFDSKTDALIEITGFSGSLSTLQVI
jgi:hypothetical protein